MRFMLLLKGDPQVDETGAPVGDVPLEQVVNAMHEYQAELTKAGVLLAAEGLYPSATGARVRYLDGKRTVIDGPFAESKELIAGFYLIQVQSMEEAIEWASRCPVEYAVRPGQEAVVEVRQVGEAAEVQAMIDR